MRVKRRDGAVLRRLRTLYNVGTVGDLTDGQLLERFTLDADELAELALAGVWWSGTRRWSGGVCFAILHNEHLAEDAVQATFLVLVRRARSLWVPTRWARGCIRSPAALRLVCGRAVNRRREHERRSAESHTAQVGPGREPSVIPIKMPPSTRR